MMARVNVGGGRLGQLQGRLRQEVGRAVYAAADLIRTEAALSITRGSISGKGHVPSAPGEPPNRDTGHLDTNIVVVMDQSALRAQVVSNAPYSAALEYGTSKMAARPFLRPAVAKSRDEAIALVRAAVQRATRG